MRIYEELFIVRPNVTEEEIDTLSSQLEGVIKKTGGKLDKIDRWGVRTLAYRVKKNHEGYFVLLNFHAAPDTVKEVERRLRVSDMVLKFLTVRMDEKLKWLERRKKRREARAAKKPAMPAPPPVPAAPAAPAPPAPGAPVPASPAEPVTASAEKQEA